MPSNYTPAAVNHATITCPVSSDPPNASSVTTPLQELADNIAYLALNTWSVLGTFLKGIVVTNSTANGAGTTSTGNGSGAGVAATGGATGVGVTGQGGATNKEGGVFTGGGSQTGLKGIGGSGGGHGVLGQAVGSGTAGLRGQGDVASDGIGVEALGTGSQAGLDATGGATGVAIQASPNPTRGAINLGNRNGNPSTPVQGEIYYDSGDGHFYGFSNLGGGTWRQLD